MYILKLMRLFVDGQTKRGNLLSSLHFNRLKFVRIMNQIFFLLSSLWATRKPLCALNKLNSYHELRKPLFAFQKTKICTNHEPNIFSIVIFMGNEKTLFAFNKLNLYHELPTRANRTRDLD